MDELTSEIKKLNQKLDQINSSSKYFVYNSRPFKFLALNFLAGTFSALGSLFGTAIIASILIFLASKIDFVQPVTSWIESVMSGIDWQKILSTSILSSPVNFGQ